MTVLASRETPQWMVAKEERPFLTLSNGIAFKNPTDSRNEYPIFRAAGSRTPPNRNGL